MYVCVCLLVCCGMIEHLYLKSIAGEKLQPQSSNITSEAKSLGQGPVDFFALVLYMSVYVCEYVCVSVRVCSCE